MFKTITSTHIDGLIIGKPYFIEYSKYGRFDYGYDIHEDHVYIYHVNNRRLGIYCGKDADSIKFRRIDFRRGHCNSEVCELIPVVDLDISADELFGNYSIPYSSLNSYGIVKRHYGAKDGRNSDNMYDIPIYKYDVSDERNITIRSISEKDSLNVVVNDSVKVFNSEIFAEYEKIYLVETNGDIHTKTYTKDDIIIDGKNIKFTNGSIVTVDDVDSGKVDILNNIINVHVDGDTNV